MSENRVLVPFPTRRQPTHHISKRAGHMRMLGASALAAAIFTVDTFTMLTSAVAVLYVLVVVLVGSCSRTTILRFAAACVVLTTISLVLTHLRGSEKAAFLHYALSDVALAVTTIAMLSYANTREILSHSEERYRKILNTLAIAIWQHDFSKLRVALDGVKASGVVDLRGYIDARPSFLRAARSMVSVTDVNDTALRMMSVTSKSEFFENLDGPLPNTDEAFRECMLAIDEGRDRFEAETTIRTARGKELRVLVAFAFPTQCRDLRCIQASIIDVTERQRMRELLDQKNAELEQVLRSATIGAAAASIAHEVNQPIAAVTTCADAARRWLERNPPNIAEARDSLAQVVTSAQRAAEVVKRVRRLLGNADPERMPVAIDVVVTEATRFLQRELEAHGIDMTLDLQAPGAVVMGDRILLQQTVINLTLNAIQAMQDTDRPSLKVSTAKSNGNAVISVMDCGPGFAAGEVDRAFHAFYSTKTSGMGLGLAICKWTVEAHDGTISIRANEEGSGARVQITIPLDGHDQAEQAEYHSA